MSRACEKNAKSAKARSGRTFTHDMVSKSKSKICLVLRQMNAELYINFLESKLNDFDKSFIQHDKIPIYVAIETKAFLSIREIE